MFAVDCGIVLNPDLVRGQVEGGIRWGMQSIPTIEVHLIESTESPSGVGEVSVPTVAPALANAIFALTGSRIRRLPMSHTIQIF